MTTLASSSSSSPTLLVSLDTPESTTPGLTTVSVTPTFVSPLFLHPLPPSGRVRSDPVYLVAWSSQLSVLSPTTTIPTLLASSHLLTTPPPPPAPAKTKKNKAPRADAAPSPNGGFNLYQLLVELPKWTKEEEDEEPVVEEGEVSTQLSVTLSSERVVREQTRNGRVPN